MIVDNSNKVEYKDFCISISKINKFSTSIKGDDLIQIYRNLIVGLINNCDLLIFDNVPEQKFKSLYGIEYSRNIKKNSFLNEDLTIENILQKLKTSSSKISLFTSGTTGKPKKITHKFTKLIKGIKIDSDFKQNIWGMTYNPVHIGGLSVFFQAFLNQSSLINCYGLFGNALSGVLLNEKVTHLSATPTYYLNNFEKNRVFPEIQIATLGGEIASEGVFEKLRIIFPNAKFRNIYATTESGPLLTSDSHLFTVNGVENVKVIENKLHFRKSKTNNWICTEDMVEFVDEYKFQISGRSSNSMNIGGILVNLDMVQSRIAENQMIRDCLVYTRSNKLIGHLICAEIVPNNKEDQDRILNDLKDLPIHLRPRKINFVKELKISRNGKKIR